MLLVGFGLLLCTCRRPCSFVLSLSVTRFLEIPEKLFYVLLLFHGGFESFFCRIQKIFLLSSFVLC